MKKYVFILSLVYLLSIFALTVYTDQFNGLSVFGILVAQIFISIILLFLFRNQAKQHLKTLAGLNIAFFAVYSILQNFFILTGSRLETILANSNFINSNNVTVQANNPIEDTITGIVIFVILHWFVTYRLSRAKTDETV